MINHVKIYNINVFAVLDCKRKDQIILKRYW